MPKGTKDNRGKPPTPDVEFWRQQEWESDEDYAKFATYRDMGPARRLRAAAGIFYDRTDTGPTPYQYQEFKNKSSLNLWTTRVEVFDTEEDLRRSQEMEQFRSEMIENHHRLGRMGENVVAQKLLAWLRDPDGVPNGQVVHLLQVATTLSRMTLGEPSERLETIGDADQARPDYSMLSDEEVDFLHSIGLKLFGGG